jgi:hypothetical protein
MPFLTYLETGNLWVELREQVLLAELLNQMDSVMREMLSRGLVFELAVLREALIAVCRGGFSD